MENIVFIAWLITAAIYLLFVYKDRLFSNGLAAIVILATIGFPIGFMSAGLSALPMIGLVMVLLRSEMFLAKLIPELSTATLFADNEGTWKVPTNYTPNELLLAVLLVVFSVASFYIGVKLVRYFWGLPRIILMLIVGLGTAMGITGVFGFAGEQSVAKFLVEGIFNTGFNLSWLIVFAVLSFFYGALCGLPICTSRLTAL